MFGKKKRMIEEQRQKIAELERTITGLTEENAKYAERVADVERRESGIGRAISEATVTADKMIDDAQKQAGALLEQAQADCDAAKRDAENMVDDAYRNARDIVKEAETEGERKLGEVQERIDTYAALLRTYDRLVQEQIQIAQDNAKRFAELSRALHNAVPQILSQEGTLLEPEETPVQEEPKSENPAEEPSADANEDAEPVEDAGEGTPLSDETIDDAAGSGDERLWTVDEIARKPESGESHVDAIINEIITASEESE